MKVVSLVAVALGFAAAAFAQQARFPGVQSQNVFQTEPSRLATVPQATLPPVTQYRAQSRYELLPSVRLPTVRSQWGDNPARNKETAQASREVESAVAKLKKATSDDGRKAAEEIVKEKLGKLFDLKTASREREITALEKRLAEMRSQLEKRSDEKNQIVRLRLQTLVNEANGLTF